MHEEAPSRMFRYHRWCVWMGKLHGRAQNFLEQVCDAALCQRGRHIVSTAFFTGRGPVGRHGHHYHRACFFASAALNED